MPTYQQYYEYGVISSDIHLSMHNAYALLRVENLFSQFQSVSHILKPELFGVPEQSPRSLWEAPTQGAWVRIYALPHGGIYLAHNYASYSRQGNTLLPTKQSKAIMSFLSLPASTIASTIFGSVKTITIKTTEILIQFCVPQSAANSQILLQSIMST